MRLPQSVTVLVSNDGKNFSKVATVVHKQDNRPTHKKTLSADIADVKARYVRFVATTNGQWLFVDQVLVNPKVDK